MSSRACILAYRSTPSRNLCLIYHRVRIPVVCCVAPLDLYHQPIQINFIEPVLKMDHLVMRRQAVHEAFQTQSVLRSPDTNTSIQVRMENG